MTKYWLYKWKNLEDYTKEQIIELFLDTYKTLEFYKDKDFKNSIENFNLKCDISKKKSLWKIY